jgi:hypothetical protein
MYYMHFYFAGSICSFERVTRSEGPRSTTTLIVMKRLLKGPNVRPMLSFHRAPINRMRPFTNPPNRCRRSCAKAYLLALPFHRRKAPILPLSSSHVVSIISTNLAIQDMASSRLAHLELRLTRKPPALPLNQPRRYQHVKLGLHFLPSVHCPPHLFSILCLRPGIAHELCLDA